MAIETAMLLAAGRGERLQPLTLATPKPLLPVHGKPFIIHLIEKLAASGIKKIVINVSYLAEKIMTALGNGDNWGLEIVYSEEEKPLGAGGGVQQALPLLGEKPFLLVSSDVYTHYPFEQLIRQDWHNTLLYAVLTDKRVYDKGDFDLQDNRLILATNPTYIYGSIAVIDPIIFAAQQPGFAGLMPAFTIAINENKAFGEYYDDMLNVNTLDEYLHITT